MLAKQWDYSKLKGAIKEVFGTQAAFAEAIGISEVSVSKKLNRQTDWTDSEIEKSMLVLSRPVSQIHTYFFSTKVEKNSTIDQKTG